MYRRYPTPFLIINDVSIFLHLGGLRYLLKVLGFAQTVLINGYQGNSLLQDLGTHISARESRLMRILSRHLTSYTTSPEFAINMRKIFESLPKSIHE